MGESHDAAGRRMPLPRDGGEDGGELTPEDLVRETAQRLHPFSVDPETMKADLAADALADQNGVDRELRWLGSHDITISRREPDPVGVLGAALTRLAQSDPSWPGRDEQVWCAAGWHRLVAETDRRLAAIDPEYRLRQVKEKFGLLVVYADPSPDAGLTDERRRDFQAVIVAARSASAFLCEVCGRADAHLRGAFPQRVRTLCRTHATWGVHP